MRVQLVVLTLGVVGSSVAVTLDAKVYPRSEGFPEQTTGVVKRDNTIALAFCGGGNRAHGANVGFLRALHHQNLLSKFDYLSTVSGSSWSGAILTFQKTHSLTALLGKQSDFSALSLDALNKPPAAMAKTATFGFLDIGKEAAKNPLSSHSWWSNMMGTIFLEPFNLSDTTKTFVQDAKSLQGESMGFYTANEDLPFWIPIGAVLGPKPGLLDRKLKLGAQIRLLEMTPMYSGIATPLETIDYSRGDDSPIGGGYVDTFAFSSPRPLSMGKENMVQVDVNLEKPFTLADAIGISSMAVSYDLERFHLGILDPKFDYWPVESNLSSTPDAQEYYGADGGVLDVAGIMPILQRKVKKAVVCMSSADKVPTKEEFDGCDKKNMDDDIINSSPWAKDFASQYFGYWKNVNPCSGFFQENQVFEKEQFLDLLCQIQTNVQNGKPSNVLLDHTTVKNTRYGIPAGQQIQILWVYLTDQAQYLPKETQDEIEKGKNGKFANFPNYNVVTQAGLLDPVALKTDQVNLLAAAAEWSLTGKDSGLDKIMP
uniref:PNPLA domain-containing protein n=1 Tax=Mucochytrium quahogii TaxID=96639 RepID=A0A7S2RZQ3_9STRA|mmetsp:Transcript_22553/g.49026  ORF Transcript_22553/g.49026 Transcript_22553/m.49026 type:complete len:540 (+) Transcript_22553:16-1635(+)